MKIGKSADKVGILGSFLLVQFCPICIPAIGAFLASIGLGFLVSDPVLHWLLVVVLLLAIAGIAFSSIQEHKKIGPLLLTIPAALSIYLARWVLFNNLWLYFGVVLFIAASVWNIILRKKGSCSPCATSLKGGGKI